VVRKNVREQKKRNVVNSLNLFILFYDSIQLLINLIPFINGILVPHRSIACRTDWK